MLDGAIQQALTTVLVYSERFGIAAGKDTDTGRYRGLVVPPDPNASIQVTNSTVLIDADKAQEQLDSDRAAEQEAATRQTEDGAEGVGPVDFAWTGTRQAASDSDALSPAESALEAVLARFFGSVKIDPDRYSRDIGNVTREVIDRLSGAGARLEITIDIQATKPEGFDEAEVRTISENARVLKFDPSSGFEKS